MRIKLQKIIRILESFIWPHIFNIRNIYQEILDKETEETKKRNFDDFLNNYFD